jgi:hypothetical protein
MTPMALTITENDDSDDGGPSEYDVDDSADDNKDNLSDSLPMTCTRQR